MNAWDFLALSGMIAWACAFVGAVRSVLRAWRGLCYRLRWALTGWKRRSRRYGVSREGMI